jgi:two-component system, OmpR family, response regulator
MLFLGLFDACQVRTKPFPGSPADRGGSKSSWTAPPPRSSAGPAAVVGISAVRYRAGVAPPKILIVDDNAELLALLARLMEAQGWVAITSTRGQIALDVLNREKPAAAVVDVLLPDMMGYDVAKVLRQKNVPFVLMTGVFKGGRAANEARAQYGSAGYFEKPFDAGKLLEVLRGLLPGSTAAPGPKPGRPAAPPAGDEVAELSEFDLEVAVEADEPVDSLELTGKVTVKEEGKASAVIQAPSITVAPLAAPGRPAAAQTPSAAPPTGPIAPAPRTDLSRTEGDLGERFPDLVTAFYLAQQTGELTVQKRKVKKVVYFEQGRPCFALSNLLADHFAPFLVRVGKITQSQLALCTAEAEKSGRRSSDVLVGMGLLKESEKLYFVAQQVKAIIYSIFGWEEGQYRIQFADRAAKEAVKLDLHPANLIVRGVKKLYKPQRLYRLLSPEDRLMPSPQPAYGLHEVELERWEAELLPKVDGTRTLAELIRIANRPDHSVYGFLYSMAALKILVAR